MDWTESLSGAGRNFWRMGTWRYTPEVMADPAWDDPDYEPFPYAGTSPHVPGKFLMDPIEHNCLGHAEQLADLNPGLRYQEGWTRMQPGDEWGAHAWCETPQGEVVDPYAEWQWPGRQLEYKRAEPHEDPFGRGRGWE